MILYESCPTFCPILFFYFLLDIFYPCVISFTMMLWLKQFQAWIIRPDYCVCILSYVSILRASRSTAVERCGCSWRKTVGFGGWCRHGDGVSEQGTRSACGVSPRWVFRIYPRGMHSMCSSGDVSSDFNGSVGVNVCVCVFSPGSIVWVMNSVVHKLNGFIWYFLRYNGINVVCLLIFSDK